MQLLVWTDPGVKCLCPLMEKPGEKSAKLEPSETGDEPGRILIAAPGILGSLLSLWKVIIIPLVVSDVHDSNGSDPLRPWNRIYGHKGSQGDWPDNGV